MAADPTLVEEMARVAFPHCFFEAFGQEYAEAIAPMRKDALVAGERIVEFLREYLTRPDVVGRAHFAHVRAITSDSNERKAIRAALSSILGATDVNVR